MGRLVEPTPPETTSGRSPRDRATEINRGPNRFEPSADQVAGNPEPEGKDYRALPLPSLGKPTIDK